MSEKARTRRLDRDVAIYKPLNSQAAHSLNLDYIWWGDECFFRLIDFPRNRNNDRIWIPNARRKSEIDPEKIARGTGGPMAGVMVTLSVSRLKGAITAQILKTGVKIDQEVYMESLQDHISPHIEAAYETESERKKWIWRGMRLP